MRLMLIILLSYTENSLETTYHWHYPPLGWGVIVMIILGFILCIAQDVLEVMEKLKKSAE